MIKVKICGITNRVDALNAVSLGADALGFVFADSPRKITPLEAKKITAILPPYITTVGLFVNEQKEKVEEIMKFCNLNTAQFHGNETTEYCNNKYSFKTVKAIHIKDKESLKLIPQYKTSAILLDTYVEDKLGGTGKSFNWNLIESLIYKYFIILAGGLTPDNIEEAIKIVNPYAVDVSSGVEKNPGKKDFQRMRLFIEKVQSYKNLDLEKNF